MNFVCGRKGNGMDDAVWTFDPVYPEFYPTISPKVIVVGPEPNDNGLRPARDMGLWFRTAAAKGYWGNPTFYEETLRQVRAVLGDKRDNEILQHMRYVDLKALGGDGSADEDEVAAWVRGHLATAEAGLLMATAANPSPMRPVPSLATSGWSTNRRPGLSAASSGSTPAA